MTVALSFLIFYFGFLMQPAQAAAYTLPATDGNGYFSTQTLTKANSPYAIIDPCSKNTLPAERTITIEAGVIIKFAIGPGI